jgi:hypothetical protein
MGAWRVKTACPCWGKHREQNLPQPHTVPFSVREHYEDRSIRPVIRPSTAGTYLCWTLTLSAAPANFLFEKGRSHGNNPNPRLDREAFVQQAVKIGGFTALRTR